MRRILILGGMSILGILFLAACTSTPRVEQVHVNEAQARGGGRTAVRPQVHLTGRWNDSDVRHVCESLINDFLSSPRVAQFIQEYSTQNAGRRPAVLVGSFRNETSEHINMGIITINMETAIVNSGKLDFVAGGDTRQEIRAERMDQQMGDVSDETAAALGRETGAALLLTGAVRSIVERAGNTTVRSYFVDAQMTAIETNTRIWMGTNNDIKRIIQQPRRRI